MNYWTREIAGWMLLALGLFIFYRSYGLLTIDNLHILQGSSLTLIGIFLFRGGIHLLKIAVAARLCTEARDQMDREPRVVRAPARGKPVVTGRLTSF